MLLFPFLVPRFSTDEGQCWKFYNFTEQPFFFAGLASEPGTKAMNVSVWGFRPEEDGQPMWVTVTIDFQSLITRECESRRRCTIYLCFPGLTHFYAARFHPVHEIVSSEVEPFTVSYNRSTTTYDLGLSRTTSSWPTGHPVYQTIPNISVNS